MIHRIGKNLSTQNPVAESTLSKLHKSKEGLGLVSQYDREVARMTLAINKLNNKTIVDLELLYELKNTLEEETSSDEMNLVEIYREAKINFPELVLKRLDEVKKFHASITMNMRLHLQPEIKAIEKRINNQKIEKLKLEKRRSQLMGILQSGAQKLKKKELPIATGTNV